MESKIVSFLKRLLIKGELDMDLRKDALTLLFEQPSEVVAPVVKFLTTAGEVCLPEIISKQVKLMADGGDRIGAVKLMRAESGCSLAAAVAVLREVSPQEIKEDVDAVLRRVSPQEIKDEAKVKPKTAAKTKKRSK